MSSKIQRRFAIVNLGSEYDAVILEEVIFSQFPRLHTIAVDWENSVLTIESNSTIPPISKLNDKLVVYGIRLSKSRSNGIQNSISLNSNGSFTINSKILKLSVSAFGFALGLLVIVSALIDYQGFNYINTALDIIYAFGRSTSLWVALFTSLLLGVVSGITSVNTGVSKLRIFIATRETEKINTQVILLNAIAILMSALSYAIVVLFAKAWFEVFSKSFETGIFMMLILLLIMSLSIIGIYRKNNVIPRLNYLLSGRVLSLYMKSNYFGSALGGLLEGVLMNPIRLFMLISSLILFQLDNGTSLFLAFVIGEIIVESLCFLRKTLTKATISLNGSYFRKVVGYFVFIVSITLLNASLKTLSLPSIDTISLVQGLWEIVFFATLIVILVWLINSNLYRLTARPFSIQKLIGGFMAGVYVLIILQLVLIM